MRSNFTVSHWMSFGITALLLRLSSTAAAGTAVDYAQARANDSLPYVRCKETHRCNFAYVELFDESSVTKCTVRQFRDGEHRSCSGFTDFEDWKIGTGGWTSADDIASDSSMMGAGVQLNPWAFSALPSLHLNSSQRATFDTGALTLNVTDTDGSSKQFLGEMFIGTDSSESGVFCFAALYIGPSVQVTFTGNRSIGLLSRTSIYWDTHATPKPGSAGGFPGGLSPCDRLTNCNGPASANARVVLQTLTTSGANVDEVQSVTTTSRAGQTVRGYFLLSFKGQMTRRLAAAISASELEAALEADCPEVGDVTVSRSQRGSAGNYTWWITFASAVGNVLQLQVRDHLRGIGSKVTTATVTEGNTIGGTYRLKFGTNTTADIPVNATADELQEFIESDLTEVRSAHVVRSDTSQACLNGQCANGPNAALGYTYYITIQTDANQQQPTGVANPQYTSELPVVSLVVASTAVTGVGAAVLVSHGHRGMRTSGLPRHMYEGRAAVSLNFGGFGGTGWGAGGMGHSRHCPPRRFVPSHDRLVGGSGGAVGGLIAQQSLSVALPSGRGGNGGAAIEMAAMYDIVIGRHGEINVDGGRGEDALYGGGGGSGGHVVLYAGGVVTIHGNISVKGGNGGSGVGWNSRGGGGGGGGQVVILAQSTTFRDGGRVDVAGGVGGLDEALAVNGTDTFEAGLPILADKLEFKEIVRTTDNVDGADGILLIRSIGGTQYGVDPDNGGAEDTDRALRIQIAETVQTASSVTRTSPFASNGVYLTLPKEANLVFSDRGITASQDLQQSKRLATGDVYNPERPGRFTTYFRVATQGDGGVLTRWGPHFALYEHDVSYPESGHRSQQFGGPGSAGGGRFGNDTVTNEGVGGDASIMIGFAIIDGSFRHGANYRHSPGLMLHHQSPASVAKRGFEYDRWYKLDIFMEWGNQTYRIRIDDETIVYNASFSGSRLRRVGAHLLHTGTMWIDEVYVGPEYTLGFECPRWQEAERPEIWRPIQTGWSMKDVGGPSFDWEITRHSSHVSRRPQYTGVKRNGLVFGDGEPHRRFFSDIETKTVDGDHKRVHGVVHAGAMTYVPGDRPTERLLDTARTTATDNGGWQTGLTIPEDPNTEERMASQRSTLGTTGRYYWFGEHDTLYDASTAPRIATGAVCACSTNDYYSWKNEGVMHFFVNVSDNVFNSTEALRVERPRVIHNKNTSTYVMWGHADSLSNNLRLAMVATSGYINGPYRVSRTLHPDGNSTVDLQLLQDKNGTAYLVRTYYATVQYWLPEPVMQPLWESVKEPDGDTNFALSYHRAFYHPEYDNPDDIYMQRWRFEDKAWRIVVGDWVETLDLDANKFILTNTATGERLTYTPEGRQPVLERTLDVHTFRDIQGQGQPVILSRFKNHTLQENNLWSPDSVPAVKTQSWYYNYEDKNIADNPPHPAVADKLIGPHQNVESRRTKYIAISKLAEDYLDTSGYMRLVQGELEDQQDLIAVMNAYGEFDWSTDDQVRSTYPFSIDARKHSGPSLAVNKPFKFDTEVDWFDRFHQYYIAPNDRRNNFVNFRDQFVVPELRSTTDPCPAKHQAALDKRAACEAIRLAHEPDDSPAQLNMYFEWQSFASALDTSNYEGCLDEVQNLLEAYDTCLNEYSTRFPPSTVSGP